MGIDLLLCSLNQFAEPTELALPGGGSLATPPGIGASPRQRAFFFFGVDGVSAPAVFSSDAVVSRGSGPPQRGIVRSLSSLRPGRLRSPGVSNASLPRPRPVPACVSPEDPPRSRPGLSIPWPRSLAERDSSCACFFATGFPILSVSAEDTEDVDGFSFCFMSSIFRMSLVLRLALAPDTATLTNGIAGSIGLWPARASAASRNPPLLAE